MMYRCFLYLAVLEFLSIGKCDVVEKSIGKGQDVNVLIVKIALDETCLETFVSFPSWMVQKIRDEASK
jgi:hypothetical protein